MVGRDQSKKRPKRRTVGNDVTAVIESVETDEKTRPQRRRSELSTSERNVLIGLVIAGAILGGISPGEPTGHTVVDIIYRSIFVAALGLAGSRARRWSLIASSAIAAVGSLGLGLILGAIALLMAVFLAGKDLRNRIYGAVIGTLVGLTLLRLNVGAFLGSSAILAALAAGVLLWSGYKVSRRRTKKVWRRIALGCGVVAAIGMVQSLYQVATYNAPLRTAVQDTIDGVGLVQDGKTSDGAQKFATAATGFDDVATKSGRPWFLPARMVPIVSQNLAVIRELSNAGASLAQAAERTASEVDYERIRRPGGGVDLNLLNEFSEPVLDANSRLVEAQLLIDELDSPWIVGPLASKIGEFQDEVTDLSDQTELAATALQYGPALLGGDGERRYLALLGNPAELRDLGGHIGNWAELRVLDGTIELIDVGTPLEISQPELDTVLDETKLFPPSVLAMRPGAFPQNWGVSADFPTDARLASKLYGNAVGRKIDGVFYADPYALAAMLEITGPQPVPGLDRELTSADAVEFLTLGQFTEFEDPNDGNAALTAFVENLFGSITSSTLPGPREIGRLFGPLVRDGRFRMVTFNEADSHLLGRLGLNNGFQPTDGQDLFAAVTRNANPSKIDTFLRRSTTYNVDWDPKSGSVTALAQVTLTNEAPTSGFPEYVLGNSAGLPYGTNISDLAIITPFEATRVTVDGIDASVRPLRDGNVWRHTVRVEIPPGGSVEVAVALEGSVDPGPIYQLRFSGQSLVEPSSTKVSVTARGFEIIPGPDLETTGGSANITLRDVGQSFLTVGVQ